MRPARRMEVAEAGGLREILAGFFFSALAGLDHEGNVPTGPFAVPRERGHSRLAGGRSRVRTSVHFVLWRERFHLFIAAGRESVSALTDSHAFA